MDDITSDELWHVISTMRRELYAWGMVFLPLIEPLVSAFPWKPRVAYCHEPPNDYIDITDYIILSD